MKGVLLMFFFLFTVFKLAINYIYFLLSCLFCPKQQLQSTIPVFILAQDLSLPIFSLCAIGEGGEGEGSEQLSGYLAVSRDKPTTDFIWHPRTSLWEEAEISYFCITPSLPPRSMAGTATDRPVLPIWDF